MKQQKKARKGKGHRHQKYVRHGWFFAAETAKKVLNDRTGGNDQAGREKGTIVTHRVERRHRPFESKRYIDIEEKCGQSESGKCKSRQDTMRHNDRAKIDTSNERGRRK